MTDFTILAVDDSALSRRNFVAKPLRQAGFHVVEAVNGREGLEAVQSQKPDLIVSDLLMPEMDGFEFVEQIRSLGIETPIIVATADIQSSSRQKLEAFHIAGFLNKPFSADVLVDLVRGALKEDPKETLCTETK